MVDVEVSDYEAVTYVSDEVLEFKYEIKLLYEIYKHVNYSDEPYLLSFLGLAATCLSHSYDFDEEYEDAYVLDADLTV